jgi:hypothetical protein
VQNLGSFVRVAAGIWLIPQWGPGSIGVLSLAQTGGYLGMFAFEPVLLLSPAAPRGVRIQLHPAWPVRCIAQPASHLAHPSPRNGDLSKTALIFSVSPASLEVVFGPRRSIVLAGCCFANIRSGTFRSHR